MLSMHQDKLLRFSRLAMEIVDNAYLTKHFAELLAAVAAPGETNVHQIESLEIAELVESVRA